MDQAARNSRDEEAIVDLQLNRVLQLLVFCRKHIVKTLGLGYGSREPIKDEARLL